MVIILPHPPRPSAPSPLLSLISIKCIFDDITMCYFIQLLILVLNLEQRLTVLDGGLHHYRTCPENITVHHDVVVEDLGKDPPVLQPPIKRLVTRPHRSTTDVNDCVTADDGASKEWWVAVLWQRGGTLFTFILLHLIYGTVQRLGA